MMNTFVQMILESTIARVDISNSFHLNSEKSIRKKRNYIGLDFALDYVREIQPVFLATLVVFTFFFGKVYSKIMLVPTIVNRVCFFFPDSNEILRNGTNCSLVI